MFDFWAHGVSGRVFNQVMRHLNPWGTQLRPRPASIQRFPVELPENSSGNFLAVRPHERTPDQFIRWEYFRLGTQPTATSNRFENEPIEEDYDEYEDYYEEDIYEEPAAPEEPAEPGPIDAVHDVYEPVESPPAELPEEEETYTGE